MSELTDRLLDFFFPPHCAFCHHLMPSGVLCCEHCRRTLPYTSPGARNRKLANIERCVSALYYEGTVRASLLRFKFHSVTANAEIYGEILAKSIDENGISCDSITWVPLSRRRKWLRGYDQSQLIAEETSRRLGVPCLRLLDKIRNNPPQSGRGGPAARRANVAGVYRCAAPELTAGKRILLIDDIVTTGSTLSAAAAVLRKAGAKSVTAATVACARD